MSNTFVTVFVNLG